LSSKLNLEPQTTQRSFGLDALRVYAVFCVVYAHGYGLTSGFISESLYSLPVLDGVSMFFVLSGFLIGRILLTTVAQTHFNGRVLIHFWIRRWFRTLPNYFLVLVLLVLANNPKEIFQSTDVVSYFLFSQNFSSIHPSFFPEAWSLAVEEWFYLLIPVPIYVVTRLRKINRQKFILLWIFVIIFSITAFRIYRINKYGYDTIGVWDDNLRKQVITRLDSLMFGVLGAYMYIHKHVLWIKYEQLAFRLGVFFLIFASAFWRLTESMFFLNYISLSLIAIGVLLTLPKLSATKCNNVKLVNTITFFSLISYAMYLLNLSPVQGVVMKHIMPSIFETSHLFSRHPFITQYIIYWSLTIILSYVVYRFYENPITELRNKFNYLSN
jgi:peptidoglycan/LPS O-acetylase OafA/YrhL